MRRDIQVCFRVPRSTITLIRKVRILTKTNMELLVCTCIWLFRCRVTSTGQLCVALRTLAQRRAEWSLNPPTTISTHVDGCHSLKLLAVSAICIYYFIYFLFFFLVICFVCVLIHLFSAITRCMSRKSPINPVAIRGKADLLRSLHSS
jgi:hypothetical protein